jgi:hypothetical protein
MILLRPLIRRNATEGVPFRVSGGTSIAVDRLLADKLERDGEAASVEDAGHVVDLRRS